MLRDEGKGKTLGKRRAAAYKRTKNKCSVTMTGQDKKITQGDSIYTQQWYPFSSGVLPMHLPLERNNCYFLLPPALGDDVASQY